MKIPRKHFAVAMIDQANNMFIKHQDNDVEQSIEFVHKIPEHLSRIIELSENQHIYMDYNTFVALGKTSIPNRFTRVFCDNQQQLTEVGLSVMYRVHHRSELERILSTTNHYQPETIIFFMGSGKFLNTIFQYSAKLLLTVIEGQTKVEDNIELDKFPMSEAKYNFSKRKDIIPEMMPHIAEYRKLKASTKVESNVEIADNGMKIIKTSETSAKENEHYDAIYDTPNYMFYEFNK